MSGLIYKGNAVTGLGEFMPSLIIEKVYVNDASLDLHLAVYWPQEPTLEYLQSLADASGIPKINFYALLAFDQNNTEKVINREISIFSQFVDSSAANPTYLEVGPGGSALGYVPNYITNFKDITANVFVNTAVAQGDGTLEIVYDNDEKALFKVTFTTSLPWEDTYLPTTFNAPASFTDFASFFEDKVNANKSMTLFCFPTIYDVTDDIYWDSARMDLTSPNNVVRILSDGTEKTMGYNYSFPLDATPLIERGIGDITYESIFVDGQVDTEPKVAYIDEEGVYFDEVPLMALNAEYYKPDSITHAEIIDKFNIILSSFDPDPETEIELSGVVDSISYALSVYGEDADILQQLSRIKEAFPERGSATKTGRLFDQFSSAIAGTNRQIKSNDILHKVLYHSPKVIDTRTVPKADVVSTSTPTTTGRYLNASNEILYSTALISREVYRAELGLVASDGSYAPAQALNWGYFFCDFEKILHRDSDLAQVLDIRKVDKLFGYQLMNAAVKLESLTFRKGSDGGCTFDCTYAPWTYAAPTWPEIDLMTYESTSDARALQSVATATPGYDGTTTPDNSYVALRAFDPANTQGLYSADLGHNYRLMCFEFQDYYEVDFIDGQADQLELPGQTGYYYLPQIKFQDYSMQVLSRLITLFESALSAFSDYADLASEHCNYNDRGSYFNSFFVNAATAEYEANPEEAPWFIIASIYYLLLDLIDSQSDKSVAEIGALAAQLVTKINPNSGTLESITNFLVSAAALKDQLQALLTFSLGRLVAPNGEAHRTQRLSDGQVLTYTNLFWLTDVPIYVGTNINIEVQADTGTTATCKENSEWTVTKAVGDDFGTYWNYTGRGGFSREENKLAGNVFEDVFGWSEDETRNNSTLDRHAAFDRISQWLANHDQNGEQQDPEWDWRSEGISSYAYFRIGGGTYPDEVIQVVMYENENVARFWQWLWTGTGDRATQSAECHLPTSLSNVYWGPTNYDFPSWTGGEGGDLT